MKTMKTGKRVLLICVWFMIVISSSCYQTKDPTVAIINVQDSFGNSIAGARVYLYCVTSGCCVEPGCKQIDSSTTDVAGKAEFKFKWEAVLRVKCRKDTYITVVDTFTGMPLLVPATLYAEDWVKTERHKTVEKTVKVGVYK